MSATRILARELAEAKAGCPMTAAGAENVPSPTPAQKSSSRAPFAVFLRKTRTSRVPDRSKSARAKDEADPVEGNGPAKKLWFDDERTPGDPDGPWLRYAMTELALLPSVGL